MCLVRHGHNVTFTQMLSLNDVVNGCLELPDIIKLDNMDAGFNVTVEIYQLVGTCPHKQCTVYQSAL